MSIESTEPNRERDPRSRRRRGRRRPTSAVREQSPENRTQLPVNTAALPAGTHLTPLNGQTSTGIKPSDLQHRKPGTPAAPTTATPKGATVPHSNQRRRKKRNPSAREQTTGTAQLQIKPSDISRALAKKIPDAAVVAKNVQNISAQRLRTVRETSSGGLVISHFNDDSQQPRCAALIGRIDRRGRMMWSLPKGHIELGETAEVTAIREVSEETGITSTVIAPLGKIDYWFVSEGKRIHKTVHHFLLRYDGGELSSDDYEVAEVAWFPLNELHRRLTYSDERRLARVAQSMIPNFVSEPEKRIEAENNSNRVTPNAYEIAAAERNSRRNDPPKPRRRSRRGGRSRNSRGRNGESATPSTETEQTA